MALYADITHVGLVGSPYAGYTVYVNVTIKNLAAVVRSIMVGAALEYGVIPWPTVPFDIDITNIQPGYSYTFSGQFIVPYYPPGKVVKVHAYSYWYGGDGAWYFDDEEVKSFTIEAPPVPTEAFSEFKVASFTKV